MKRSIFTLIFILLCAGLYAQDSNTELLKKLVEKQVLTQSEADELKKESSRENNKSFASSVQKVRDAFNTPYMRFGGYGLLMYKYSDINEVKHNVEPRVIFMSVRGELFKNFNYFILGEFTDPMIHEFYAEWTPKKEFGFRFGQMKTPLSLENQLSLTEIETITNTRSVSSLIGMGDDVLKPRKTKNSGGRDIGIRVNGSLGENKLLEYTLGIYQGTGINTSENNNTKDFAGTLMLQPVRGFRIGGSAYFGEANYVSTSSTLPGEEKSHVRNRWMLSSDFKTDRFYARAEWINGKDGLVDREGVYATALYYFIPKKLNAVAKFDYYNKNKDANMEAKDYTLALNYYFYPQCRVQLNYTYSDFSKNWKAPHSNIVLGQLQIVF